MMNSMTGYGDAAGLLNGVTYRVEIRTVNNRYFKASIKLPELVAFLEEDIEELLRRNLSRGAVNYVLRLKDAPVNALFDIDERALSAVVERLSRIGSTLAVKSLIDVGSLLNLPGIIQPPSPDEQAVEQIKKLVLQVSQQAIDRLKQMRAAEGAVLAADLASRCKAIRDSLERIRARSDVVLAHYAKRLRSRVDELLAAGQLKLDEQTIAREVAIFAERSDISEEIARLDSHLKQFAESCQMDEQAGRKLEFIAQEMLREANTIASKACDTEIICCVVDIKCQIDRIKQQVQNIE